jgi:hypothetical protein
VPSASLKRRRRTDEDDEAYDRPASSRPWWWQLLLRRPRDTLACVVAAGAAVAIVVNGVYLQHGPHPAPIFAIKPLPVAASRDTVGALHRPRAADQGARGVDQDAARRDLAPSPARSAAFELPRPRPTTAPAAAPGRKDPIAELLAGHVVQSSQQPQVPPPVHQAAPPAPPAPMPPAPIPTPSRSLAQPSRQVLAVQRALSDFGYGQLKPTGLMDDQTRAAIKQFQSARNLQPTGELNDQVKRELAGMVGHELN